MKRRQYLVHHQHQVELSIKLLVYFSLPCQISRHYNKKITQPIKPLTLNITTELNFP